MFHTAEFEVWNLTSGCPAMVDAQSIFNVLGSLKRPDTVKLFSYQLNEGPAKPIFFNISKQRTGRLQRKGDFSIDTIQSRDLRSVNQLVFHIVHQDGEESEYNLSFMTTRVEPGKAYFRLNLEDAHYIEQVGQLVDGKWQIGMDDNNRPCVELRNEDIGYDRIILFGQYDWTTGYEITARLSLPRIRAVVHNAGLLFKWNPHPSGNGISLPTQWSTGLGYYASNSPGLRIRYGVDVRLDESGKKLGDYVLAEKPLSTWRQLSWKMQHARRPSGKIQMKRLARLFPSWQMKPGVDYCFRLRIHPSQYALTVWESGKKEPSPQLLVNNPEEKLATGSVGVIAYHCSMRLYEFEVSPLNPLHSEKSSNGKHLEELTKEP